MQNAGEVGEDTSSERAVEGLRAWRRRGCYGMTRVLPFLYVGSMRDVNDAEQLKEKQIECVLSVHGLNARRRAVADVNVLHIQMDDVPGANISEHFGQAVLFIHRARIKKRSVLVHCVAGVSRSVCVVAAYLIVACDMSYAAALAYIASKRPCANPNFGFRMQLAKYAQKKAPSERIAIRSYFDQEAFDELKRSDKEVLLDYPAAALPDVGASDPVADGESRLITPSASAKRKWLHDPGCLNVSAPCGDTNSTTDISFIDQ